MAAGKLTIDIDFADSTRIAEIRDDACAYWGWTATVPDPANPGQTIPNPVTRLMLLKRKMVETVREAAKAYRANTAADAARAAKVAEVEAIGMS